MGRVDRTFWSLVCLIAFNLGLAPYAPPAHVQEDPPPISYCTQEYYSVGVTYNNRQWTYNAAEDNYDYSIEIVVTNGCDEGNNNSLCYLCAEINLSEAECLCLPDEYTICDETDWELIGTLDYQTSTGQCGTSNLHIRPTQALDCKKNNYISINVSLGRPHEEHGCSPLWIDWILTESTIVDSPPGYFNICE